MIAGQRGCYVTRNQNNYNAEPGLFPSGFFLNVKFHLNKYF
jgi:hypothetical protein